MPAPRPSHSAEAARAAAAQAEFNEKRWVWVPDDKEGYLAGWVNKEEEDMLEIVMAAGGEIRHVSLYAVSRMNPPKFDRAEDIAGLTYLNEASVVHNLRLRYGSGAIYTYSGLFLVAINPYQPLPLYSDSIIQQYRGKRRDENPPHIFAVAERAWINMGEMRENQSILITGESGAGKTESTKKVIQYLAAIATDVQPPTPLIQSQTLTPSGSIRSTLPRGSSFQRRPLSIVSSPNSTASSKPRDRLGLLERQILQANPILEAFGNAQTQRNNNSSRFGKFVRISFAPDGSIAGANIDWYLLEKSRVVNRSDAERSFHVFYQLLAGGGALKNELLLDGGVDHYAYLSKSRREVDGINDRDEWSALQNALDVVGFSPGEQFDLFRIVAAILHIGNIVITATKADDALMPDPSQAERVCHLLGISVSEFTRAVLQPRVLAGREWVSQARTSQQAIAELGALCKTLYEKSFGQMVDRINRALDRPSSKSTFIGVLDIAGFEIFEVNSFEQLLINYTNEKLQQFFNHHMFVLEQEEYAREGIEWDYVNFGLDLQPTIDLIETSGNDIGILSCLDEECIMPRATDVTFTNKLHQMWSGDPPHGHEPHAGRTKYEPTRFQLGFLVQHYAGKVEYRTDGWLEKNKDPLNDNLSRILAASSEPYIAQLFAEHGDAPPIHSALATTSTVGKKRGVKKGAFRTVAQRHKEQLSSLMSHLQATQPHFVRCIVPNSLKRPGRMDVPLVLDQLRCNGVLEGIRIARLGYPNRLPFVEFRQRYEALTPGILPRGYMDGRKACLRMVEALELDKSLYRVGTSKIFFKAGVLAELEEKRDALLFDLFSRLQAAARRWSARRQIKKVLNRAVAIRTIQRNAHVYGELKQWPWWQLYTKVRPLLAATRNDEELRKKEAELLLARERAERDKQEREALENLRMNLEADKRKVEESLEAERALALDKDALLERSKRREAELEDEVAALQADMDVLDSQLDRALKLQRDSEDKYESLRQAFDEAAEHLVRLEREQLLWQGKEEGLVKQIAGAEEELEMLRVDKEDLQKVSEELKSLVSQREEDVDRTKERMEAVMIDLQGKLHQEQTQRDLLKSKSDTMERDMRLTKDQVAELTRTATEYSSLISDKEAQVSRVSEELATSKQENRELSKKLIEANGAIANLTAELSTEQINRKRDDSSRAKLQTELDQLRKLVDAKASEETRRSEVEKSKELELSSLRSSVTTLQRELAEARRTVIEVENTLKVELDNAVREHSLMKSSYDTAVDKERRASTQLAEATSKLSELDKFKRGLDSELQSVRSRQLDLDSQLADAQRSRESLERQLATATKRSQEYEDAALQAERDKASSQKSLEGIQRQLDTEQAKREKLELAYSSQKSEMNALKNRTANIDRELKSALDNLKAREWEVKQLQSRQDKTIVEHVHVLEEAKRITDQQLAEAKDELEKNRAYIRSLEKAKTRLTVEAEDLVREKDAELRAREKAVKAQEERATRASVDVDKERKARETAESHLRKLQSEMLKEHNKYAELSQHLSFVQRSKDTLEQELARLADETESPTSMAKLQRDYQNRITELERQVQKAESSSQAALRMRRHIDGHHEELRRLILSGDPREDSLRSRLLQELQTADQQLDAELPDRSKRRSTTTYGAPMPSVSTPSKRTVTEPNGDNASSHSTPSRVSQKEVDVLKHQVQALEVQLAASDKVRRHLESSLKDLSRDLETTDGSKQSLQKYRIRLARENQKLAQLLDEEAEARRLAEEQHMSGVQAMLAKFEKTIADERASYNRLEESRKALLAQQRSLQLELEEQRKQSADHAQARSNLESEVDKLRTQLEVERNAKHSQSASNSHLEASVRELKQATSSSSSAHSELLGAVQDYKAKAETYLARFEAGEVARAKAVRAESLVRDSLAEAEKINAQLRAEHKSLRDQLQNMDRTFREVQAKAEASDGDALNIASIRQRVADELEDQHQKDLEDRDFTIDQTRKKYQTELAQLSEELQSQRDTMSRLREENRKIRADYDDLQLRLDDEVYQGGAWKNEKERLITKVNDVTKAYESAAAAQAEQQSQIVTLHSQVRELRGVLNDADSERTLLAKARRALQAELEGLKHDSADTHKQSSDRVVQKLQLQNQDLERSIEEQEDRVAMAFDRMKKAESYATDCQVELGKIRVENSELEKLNAHLEKQLKELNLKIVDLETRSYASSPRSSLVSGRRQSRIEEITNQLTGGGRDARSPTKDSKMTKVELDLQRSRLDEERKTHESQIRTMRQSMDAMQAEESKLLLAKRRAEREAVDYKQKATSLEAEVERLRSRLDHVSSSRTSSVGIARR